MLITILLVVVVLVIGYFVFVNIHPVFGGEITKDKQSEYASKSNNYKKGKFINIDNVTEEITFGKSISILSKMLFNSFPNGKPKQELPMVKVDSVQLANYNSSSRLIWFGHSTFLLQADEKNILIDPILTDMPSPIRRDAQKRFNKSLPIEIEQLPKIDVVLISHDHYDHLDYESIKRLKHKVEHFIVPLGVGAHLEAWGIDQELITELDWWQEINYKDLKLVCTPAQHFSGRKLDNNASTLWCSWVVQSQNENIFFSGDSGYNGHFKTIGETYGPFDFAMMECGQYNELWPLIHMMPEETVKAGIDVKAKVIMPIHWGAFQLAMHDWNDPAKRVLKKAKELNVPIVIPKMGEYIDVKTIKKNDKWW